MRNCRCDRPLKFFRVKNTGTVMCAGCHKTVYINCDVVGFYPQYRWLFTPIKEWFLKLLKGKNNA